MKKRLGELGGEIGSEKKTDTETGISKHII